MVSFLKKRDHSKWCDDEIITRIDCKGALSLRSSKSHADHQSGVSFARCGDNLLALACAYCDLLDCFRGVKFMMLSYIFAKARAGSTYFWWGVAFQSGLFSDHARSTNLITCCCSKEGNCIKHKQNKFIVHLGMKRASSLLATQTRHTRNLK